MTIGRRWSGTPPPTPPWNLVLAILDSPPQRRRRPPPPTPPPTQMLDWTPPWTTTSPGCSGRNLVGRTRAPPSLTGSCRLLPEVGIAPSFRCLRLCRPLRGRRSHRLVRRTGARRLQRRRRRLLHWMRSRRERLSGRRSDRKTPQRSPATSSRTARRMRWDLESSLPLRGWHRSRVPPLASDLEMPSPMLSLLSCGSHRSGALPRWVPRLPLLECEQREGRSNGCLRRRGELGARLLGRPRPREMVDRAVGAHRFARGGLWCTHLLVRRRRCQPGFRSPRRRRFLHHPTVPSTFLADWAALRRCPRRLALAP